MNPAHSSGALPCSASSPVRHAGFADPVHDAQQWFRTALMALARPCQPQAVLVRLPAGPAPFVPAVAAALLTLCDGETPLWLAPTYNTQAARAWVRFHTACPLTENPAEAAFAAAAGFGELPPLATFAQGKPAWPDQSTTVLVAVPDVSGVPVPSGTNFAATGPGIRERASLALPSGVLPPDFDRYWAANNALFPLGVDMILLAPGHILGLPRTTRLTSLT